MANSQLDTNGDFPFPQPASAPATGGQDPAAGAAPTYDVNGEFPFEKPVGGGYAYGSAPLMSKPISGVINDILSSMGGAASDAFHTDNFSQETMDALRKHGVFGPAQKDQRNLFENFNQAFYGDIINGAETVTRALQAGVSALSAGAYEAAKKVGGEQFGRDIGGITELKLQGGLDVGVPHVGEAPKAIEAPKDGMQVLQNDAAEAARLRLHTDDLPEDQQPVVAPKPEEANPPAREEPTVEAAPETPTATEGKASPAEAPPADIHEAARRVAPETMQKFDALNTRMDTYRRWLDELAVTRRQMAETQAPDGPQLESLQTQLSDLQNEPGFYGKKQKLQQQIADIQDRRQTYIDDFTSRDTPDMARVRQELMKADYAKRDLAPAVFRAYQDAKDLMPEDHAELPAPEATQPEASAEPVDETATASRAPEVPTAPAKVEEITAAQPNEQPKGVVPASGTGDVGERGLLEGEPQQKLGETTPEHLDAIRQDVIDQLVKAGRPEREAKAAAEIVASRYDARAAAFQGQRGNALDLYRESRMRVQGFNATHNLPPEIKAADEAIRNAPREDQQSLRDLLASGASPEELSRHPLMQEASKRLDEITPTQILWGDNPHEPSAEWQANRVFNFGGERVIGYDEAIDRLAEKAEGYAKGEVAKDRQAYVVVGPPAAGKSTIAEHIAQRARAAIVDNDDAKAVLPEFYGGIGANAVHEESAFLGNEVLANQMEKSHNIVIPKVGHNTQGIGKLVERLKSDGYDVHLVNMRVSADEAFRRMVGRFLSTRRLIKPEYARSIGDKPTATFEALKGDERIASHAEVDGNATRGQQTVLGSGNARDALAGIGRERGSVPGSHGEQLGLGEGQSKSQSGRQEEERSVEVKAAEAAAQTLADIPAKDRTKRVPEFNPATDAQEPTPGEPAGVYVFNPTKLNVDAQRFQFKSGGDEYGVTGALRNVQRWDKAKAQAIMVWQDKNGKLWVVDGHQRSGLARRLVETGKEKDISLPGILYRETDGFTAEDMKAIAAVTNIANGSGSALDGAKILRARPDLLDDTLPLSAGKGKQAAELARLGDEPFRMVVNELVPEHQAAIVGELIPKDHARQEAAMKAIIRFEPKNAEETAALVQRVSQAELAKAEEGRQTSMFGDLESPESTVGEEMRIVGKAIKELKKDKSLFARVLANAGRIEETGSQIERDAAQSAATDADYFAKVLASDAYAAGPVREALKEAAKDLKNGNVNLTQATERVYDALRKGTADRQAETHGSDGAGTLVGVAEGGAEPRFEQGADGKPQQLIPGVAPVTTGERLALEADRPMRGGNAPAGGLFDEDARNQHEFFQGNRQRAGAFNTETKLIRLFKDANASTFMHEAGHMWLEEFRQDAQDPRALSGCGTTCRRRSIISASRMPQKSAASSMRSGRGHSSGTSTTGKRLRRGSSMPSHSSAPGWSTSTVGCAGSLRFRTISGTFLTG